MFNLKFFQKNLKILKQQRFNNLERYVDLECDLTIQGNVLPAINTLEKCFEDQQETIFSLFKIIAKRQFDKDIEKDIQLNKLAVIKTKAKISYRDKKGFFKDPLYKEYTKYKDKFLEKEEFFPIILTHPQVLSRYVNSKVKHYLYQVDGMHRVMSALEANVSKLDAYVIVNRDDLPIFLNDEDRRSVFQEGGKCTWFPRYQEIKEVGLEGKRVQEPRYTKIYDFSLLKDKIVVDFGGNIGQAAIEAYFNGAKKIYSLDYQIEAVQTGQKISDILGLGITFNTIDFNKKSFKKDLLDIVDNWDWSIYQAIYRTKEIKDVKTSFHYIVEKTKEGLIFEGNGDPFLDTNEFYQKVFDPFKFSKIDYLGHSQKRPAYLIRK